MIVTNLNRATIMCSCRNWLEYWERASGQNTYLCFGKDCINTPTIGALVQRNSPTDRAWYVIPLCDECNRHTGHEMEIWDLAKLIPVLDAKMPRTVFAPGRVASRRVTEASL